MERGYEHSECVCIINGVKILLLLWFAGYSLHEVLFLLFDFYILVSKPLSYSCWYKALASYLNGYFSVSSSDTNLTFNN